MEEGYQGIGRGGRESQAVYLQKQGNYLNLSGDKFDPNLELRIQTSEAKAPTLGEAMELREDCSQNILYFCNAFCYKTQKYEEDLLTWMVWTYVTEQNGVIVHSTYIDVERVWAVFNIWLCLFHKNMITESISCSNHIEPKIVDKIKGILFYLPEWIIEGNFLKDRHPIKSPIIRFPKNNSTLVFTQAVVGHRGRSSVSWASHLAFTENQDNFMASISTLSSTTFYTSTPNGAKGAFYETAKSDYTNKKVIKWDADEAHDEAWLEQKRKSPYFNEIWQQEFEAEFKHQGESGARESS